MVKGDEMLKIAVMAGASRALKFKEENWKATSEEVLRHVSSSMPEIINNIDSD
ncbi:MAG: hypothetical protein AABW79_00355 [Nanoarchaeota archaeon]